MPALDQGISDHVWWYSDFSEFEDFVGIGEQRIQDLAENLRRGGTSEFIINRLLKANGLKHGPCNSKEI
jgi:hypothetical protein